MLVSPWFILAAAVPMLLIGEKLVQHIGFLNRFHIPAPMVGGLLVACTVLLANVLGYDMRLAVKVSSKWWSWLVLPEPIWQTEPPVDIGRIFLVGFFACIGLNADLRLLKQASWQLPTFTFVALVLVVLQNALGVSIAHLLGEPRLLGLLCGSITLTGGHGTALGFSDLLVQHGYSAAPVVGVAAATFGLVSGGLLGGPLGGRLVQRHGLQCLQRTKQNVFNALTEMETNESGVVRDWLALVAGRGRSIKQLVWVLLCVKLGAWVSLGLQYAGLTFPVYMGAVLVGLTVRNLTPWVLRAGGRTVRCIDTQLVGYIGALCLSLFMVMAIMELNLLELAGSALPMLAILIVQVIFMALYARFVTFRVMGRDYDAAVMAGGHCGFGLGATPAAMANMKALTAQHGPAPRAFLIVPIVGSFLIDSINALVIAGYLNFMI